ncbi:MAG TPA: hypothetical protein DEP45_14975 [Armatimonadetes bacterium]|nr:hypothetical protein [Armatimonadota bacterium]
MDGDDATMSKRLIERPGNRHFYPWPVILVSCVDERGKPNIITIGASSVCCAHPWVIGFAMGVNQYSYELIKRTGDFGVNIPHRDQLPGADYCGGVSGRDTNKFEDLGWTAQPPKVIQSPLIEECPVSIECRIVQVAHLGNHDWVMGEAQVAWIEEDLLEGDSDRIAYERTDPIWSFFGEYWSIGEKLGDWHNVR